MVGQVRAQRPPLLDLKRPVLPQLDERRIRDGAAALRDHVLVAAARARRMPGDIAAALDEIAAWHPRALPVSGADVLALGGAPGPAVGRLLAALEAWWVAADFVPDREACRAQLRRLMARLPRSLA